jgi:5-methyltetrahydropteroyltriglutamate--homocysteine methyltransferase
VARVSKADLVNMRIEHVSSLLRPEWLKDLFARYRAGQVSEEELRVGEDRAIREVIAKQEAAGLPVVTDGEYRRFVFSESATKTLGGLVEAPPQVEETVKPGTRFETPPEESKGTTARIAVRRNLPLEEYRFAQQVATRPVKVAILGPDRLMRRQRWRKPAGFLDPSQLALSPQCGFASSLPGNLLGENAQWRKLDVIREVAVQVWS